MSSQNRLLSTGIDLLLIGVLLACSALESRGQVVSATIPVGANPVAIAVNPTTNKIYVTNCIPHHTGTTNTPGTVTVIDGYSNTTSTVTVGVCPVAVAVNAVTNKIYVANYGYVSLNCASCINYGSISIIDGSTNTVDTFGDPNAFFPHGIAVNPVTNKVFVTHNSSKAIVTMIDGATNAITSVPAVASPYELAVNTNTDKIYVASYGGFPTTSIAVIDGAFATATSVTDPNAVNPVSIAVNTVTNKIYVANLDDCGNGPCDNLGSITVIDGATNSTTNLFDPAVFGPHAVVVNEASNEIYVSNLNTPTRTANGGVTVIDGSTNGIFHVTDPNAKTAGCGEPIASNLAVDPMTGDIYVADPCSSNITVINGLTNTPTTLTDANAVLPISVAVNPTTDKIYVLNYGTENVTVIDGGSRAANVTLSVTSAGAGSGNGTVTSNPAGINCPGTCSATFSNGTNVSLTESSSAPSTFAGWSGACAGTAACTVTMNANEDVRATFASSAISVSLSPSLASIQENMQQVFTASVSGDTRNLGATWSIGATCNSGSKLPACSGALSPASPTTADYVSPNGSVGASVTITAMSVADITKSASITFTIAPGPPPDFSLSVSPSSLSMSSGQSQHIMWTIIPGLNFLGTISLSCAVTFASPMPSCAFANSTTSTSVTIGNGTLSSGGVLWITAPSVGQPQSYQVTLTATFGTIVHSNQIGVTVQPTADFSLAAQSAALAVQPGRQGTDVITVTPMKGSLTGQVLLSCLVSGSTPPGTCALVPSSVTPGADPATSILTFNAPGQSAGLWVTNNIRPLNPLYAVLLVLPGLTLMACQSSSKASLGHRWLLGGFFVALIALQIGCGGGSNTQPPPRQYTVTVTATLGALQHSTQVTVTVQ